MDINFYELKKLGLSYLSLVIQSLGPCGLFVPITSQSNNIILTSSGIDLIGALPSSSPLVKLITGAIQTHHSVYGDATKTFIIILSNLLSNFHALCDKELKGYNAQAILKQELQMMETKLDKINQSIRKELLPKGEECLKQIIESFFKGKFSPSVSSHFSFLILELVSKFGVCLKDNIALIDIHFEAIYLKETSSATTSSKVLPGLIFDHNSSSCKSHVSSLTSGNKNFAILNPSQDSSASCSSVTLCVNSGDDMNVYSHHYYVQWKRFLSKLVQQGIGLILIEGLSPDVVTLCCQHLDLALIDGLRKDQIDLITALTGIIPLNELDSSQTSMASFKTLGCFSIETSPLINLSFGCLNFTPHSLLLHAPTPTLCTKYFNECRNCIKMLVAWQADHQMNPRSSIIPCNGFWEKQFARLCFKQANNTKTQPISNSVWNILGNSILSIPQALHHNSGHNDRFIRLWQAFQDNEINNVQGLEATVIKETVIASVITLVKQLVSIENILKVRRIKNS